VATWVDLLQEVDALDDEDKGPFLLGRLQEELARIAGLRAKARGDEKPRNVLFYASGWLQKPAAPGEMLSIMPEDINGLMATIHGMDWPAHLTLILHTPGGSPTAAQTLVSYLRSKFDDIEVIVPTYAMSAGSMISLAADRVVMGRQSQLGPIDPQIALPGRPTMSARGIVEQFGEARADIVGDSEGKGGEQRAAALWAPILGSLGPSLLTEARNALDYGEEMVADWLSAYMLRGQKAKAAAIAKHFNDASSHKNHGRRIDRDEARKAGVIVDDLEADQDLQEAALTAYHLVTIAFEKTPIVKLMISSHDRSWLKQWIQPGPQLQEPARKQQQSPRHQGRVTPKKKKGGGGK